VERGWSVLSVRLLPVAALRAAGILMLLPAMALGQGTPSERFRVSVSAGVQPGSGSLAQALTLTRNVEPAAVRASVPEAVLPLFDAGIMIRLRRGLAAGVSVSAVNEAAEATIEAEIPHPFVFNQPRAIAGTETGLRRSEVAVHTYAAYTTTFGRTILAISGGPTFFRAEQDFITDVRHADEYPYDTAEYAGADVRRVSGNRVGYNAGLDITWPLTRRWGIGALTRFSRARSPFSLNGRTYGTLDLGGLQAAAGLRIGF
jgi:hypothetical protein